MDSAAVEEGELAGEAHGGSAGELEAEARAAERPVEVETVSDGVESGTGYSNARVARVVGGDVEGATGSDLDGSAEDECESAAGVGATGDELYVRVIDLYAG